MQFVVILATLFVVASSEISPLWPAPVKQNLGRTTLELAETFRFVPVGNAANSDRLERATDRYTQLVDIQSSRRLSHLNSNTKIQECVVSVETILSPGAEEASLDMDVDESYGISVDEAGKCQISSNTIWGAMHGMETMTQLLTREDGGVVTNYAPIEVDDKPRYTHRGLLMDSARHYLPVDTIKRLIDTLPMTKMNVLHWHIVDAQSFPLDTPSAPKLVKGAYGDLTYTMNDLEEVKHHAVDRGVRIIFEFDGPGHAASWGKGYPEIVANCQAKYWYNINNLAMNPVKDKTYDILSAVFQDVVTATGTKYMHMGGDETVYGCWAADEDIVAYMAKNDITDYDQLLSEYVQKANDIATSMGLTTIYWEDTFVSGVRPPKTSLFDVWTDSSRIANVTDAGYRVIAAPSDYWYLDHADNTWSKMWSYDPAVGLSEHQKSLLVGGEASMWAEMVDETNIFQKIWPTAAAVGERLWSIQEFNQTSVGGIGDDDNPDLSLEDATNRILVYRCRMNKRGFNASPIQPSYCPVAWV